MASKIKYGVFPNPLPDAEGNPIKPHFTDPNKITANDVEVQGVSFTPDPSFVKALKEMIYTQNKYGRGAAGRNTPYTREQIVEFLDNYLKVHHSITRKQSLRAMTINVARQFHQEHRLGSIEYGKLANMTVYDCDFLNADIEKVAQANIIATIATIVDGEEVFKA